MADLTEQTQTTPTQTADTTAVETAAPVAGEQLEQLDASDGTILGGAKPEETAPTETAAAEADADAGAEAPPAVPEVYELTPPEGLVLDETLMAEATPIFKEIGLTNEQAQALVPLVTKIQAQMAAAAQEQSIAYLDQLGAEWAKECLADPEIGGSPENLAKHTALAAKGLDMVGLKVGSKFRQVLDESRFGNHPEMVRAWAKVGAHVSEDTFVRSDAAAKDTSNTPKWELAYPGNVPNSNQ